jgi:hypothetical protein
MSEAQLTAPAEKVTPAQTNASYNNDMASRILVESVLGIYGQDDTYGGSALAAAQRDMSSLNGYSEKPQVLQDLANKIEHPDPAFAGLNASIDRDKDGNITGFTFTNPSEVPWASPYPDTYYPDQYDKAYFDGVFHLDAIK